MNAVENRSKVRCLVEQRLERFDGVFLRQVEHELVLHLRDAQVLRKHVSQDHTTEQATSTSLSYLVDSLVWFHFDVRDVPINHECNQVDDQVGILTQRREASIAQTLESSVMR